MNPARVRLLLSALVAAAVAAVGMVSSFYGYQLNWLPRSFATISTVRSLDKAVRGYKARTGEWPATLAHALAADPQRAAATAQSRPSPEDVHPQKIKDFFRHPLQYEVQGNDVLITSYGRDGKPGGNGVDADFTNRMSDKKAWRPTWGDYLTDSQVWEGVIWSALMTLAAGAATLWSLRSWARKAQPRVTGAVGIFLCSLVAASAVACVLALAHSNKGH